MNTETKSRDYLFDNCKVLLIFLVVVGHFVGPATRDNDFLLALKWVIVSFHMPAFILISGYFSKKTPSFKVLIQKLAIPYVVYEIIYYLLYTFLMHKDTSLALLKPKFTLWYLMALFFWRVITPYVKKIPGYLIVTILAGLLIGFSNMENNFLTIPRALVFYPYFLAGTLLERETVTKLRSSKKEKLLSVFGLTAIILFVIFLGLKTRVPMQIFYGRYNYSSMKQEMIEGLLWRLLTYGVGFSMTYGMLILMTEKKLFCSYIGTRTMAIYLFHGLTYSYLSYCTGLLNHAKGVVDTLLLLALCAAVTALFSLQPFTDFTNAVARLPISFKKRD